MAEFRQTSDKSPTSRHVAFGKYRFAPGTGELWLGDKEITLTPRAAALLRALVERPMQVLTKEELVTCLWGGRAVGDDALTACVHDLRRALGDDPRRPQIVETLHRRGYRFLTSVAPAGAGPSAADQSPALALPDKPSIAVLPFQNLSGDLEQDYFVDGLVEDITSALSRTRWLFVIARNSSFTFKGRGLDARQIGRELGVRYILEGSVRRSANQIRISGQLVEAATSVQLWTERFDGVIEDVFKFQEQMTAQVVGALVPQLHQIEMDRAVRKPTQRLDAYDVYLRARTHALRGTREDSEAALRLYLRAIELDPDYAAAYARAATHYSMRRANHWAPLDPADIANAERLARRAWALDQNDPAALGAAGIALALAVRDLDSGAAYVERALALDSNGADQWMHSAWIHVWSGQYDEGIERFQRAMRLSPVDHSLYEMEAGVAYGHYFTGRYDEATLWAARALQKRKDSHIALRIGAAAAAMAGKLAEAKHLCARLRAVDPMLTLSNLPDVLGPYRDPDYPVRYTEGLRRAGLPA